ncbi:coiled-coil domain-containing protein 137-like isoform X2 [Mytilus californianus]|uniref:coiled-coil domain-containing protein 137-like isoform X2 n=1 Tax=Mytilus californianus TaxID=6549 RepID=UPI00224565B7|nr:coiled-coil domain-containing protein 137-like isoform X2 [Mytilus californianus]
MYVSLVKFYSNSRPRSQRHLSHQKTRQDEAPKNDDAQEIPRKVQFFMDNKEKFKMGKRQKFKKKKAKDTFQKMIPGQTRPLDPPPVFIQKKKEKERDFLNRVDNATQKVLLQSKLSDHYGMNIEDIDGDLKKKKSMSKSRKEKLKHKKEKMKQKKHERDIDNKETEFLKDDIQFGEVVSAPPILTSKPRKAVKDEQFSKPGKRSLLLKEIILANSASSPNSSLRSSNREIGQTTKRKNLSMAKQQVMDAERQKAIDLYRLMKNKTVKVS